MTLSRLGARVAKLPSVTEVRVLEYFEGDRIVQCRSAAGDPYLKLWIDVDGDTVRWLYLRTTDHLTLNFRIKRASLRELVVSARDGFVYIVDETFAGDRVDIAVSVLPVEDIPDEYMPLEDSLHDPSLAVACGGRGDDTQSFLIDGDWTAHDLWDLERRYKHVYAFLVLATGHKAMTNKLANAFTTFEYEGGWPHVKTFESISNAVPPAERPSMVAVHYSSPGAIRYRVVPEYGERVKIALWNLGNRSASIDPLYEALHAAVQEIRKAREEGEATEEAIEQMKGPLEKPYSDLCDLLDVPVEIIKSIAADHESAAHIVLGYVRRLEELQKYADRDRAILV